MLEAIIALRSSILQFLVHTIAEVVANFGNYYYSNYTFSQDCAEDNCSAEPCFQTAELFFVRRRQVGYVEGRRPRAHWNVINACT